MASINVERYDELSTKVDAFIEHYATLTITSQPPTPQPTLVTPHQHNTPRMKLDVQKFDGTNDTGWIFKFSQFFDCD